MDPWSAVPSPARSGTPRRDSDEAVTSTSPAGLNGDATGNVGLNGLISESSLLPVKRYLTRYRRSARAIPLSSGLSGSLTICHSTPIRSAQTAVQLWTARVYSGTNCTPHCSRLVIPVAIRVLCRSRTGRSGTIERSGSGRAIHRVAIVTSGKLALAQSQLCRASTYARSAGNARIDIAMGHASVGSTRIHQCSRFKSGSDRSREWILEDIGASRRRSDLGEGGLVLAEIQDRVRCE